MKNLKKLITITLIFISIASVLNAELSFFWCGGIGHDKIVIKAKTKKNKSKIQLLIGSDPNFKNVLKSAVEVCDFSKQSGIMFYEVDELKEDTQHYYGFYVDGVFLKDSVGTFKTAKKDVTAFEFTFGNYSEVGSRHPVFDSIKQESPLFHLSLGGEVELDKIDSKKSVLEKMSLKNLSSTVQSKLYKAIPVYRTINQQDYALSAYGFFHELRDAVQENFRLITPIQPIKNRYGKGSLEYQFKIGKVVFVVTDLFSNRNNFEGVDKGQKSIMGANQKQWFKNILLNAKKNDDLIVWVNSVPYHQRTWNKYWSSEHGSNWNRYSYERDEIEAFVRDHKINKICMINVGTNPRIHKGVSKRSISEYNSMLPSIQSGVLHKPSFNKKWYDFESDTQGQYGKVNIKRNESGTFNVEWSIKNYKGRELVTSEFVL